MNFLPENLAEKALDVKKALTGLKNDVIKTLSPYALDIINKYAERYTSLKPADLTKTLGITPEQEQKTGQPSATPVQPTTTPATAPATPPHAPPPTTDSPTSPNETTTTPAAPPAPAEIPEKEPETPPLPLEQLRQDYAATAALRDSAAITAATRSDLEKQLDFALRLAPNYLLGQLDRQLNQIPDNTLNDVEKAGVKMESFSPLVDLSAFDLNKLRTGTLRLNSLTEKGIHEIVLMEDRDPLFFLNFQNFSPDMPVPLNRHGKTAGANRPGSNPNHPVSPSDSAPEQWTMADLKNLIDRLHGAGLKVNIGFWGNFEKADNNPFLRRNAAALKPLIPGSSDLNPLSIVRDEQGREMAFADYIVEQYRKLHQAFGFDGLFLGDGLMGFRDFRDPNAPYDFSQTAPLWTDFYRRIHQGVHDVTPQGKLWAYDVLGKDPAGALRHGVDLAAITPYLDTYVFQAYGNDAWGENYMALPGYDLQRDQSALAALPPDLLEKTRYTVGIGDNVEGWRGTPQSIAQKAGALSANARQGSLGVWSNQALRGIT